jgi:hypothetical protein
VPEAITLDLITAEPIELDASGPEAYEIVLEVGGEAGPRGEPATVEVGTVVTLDPDAFATVENVGTEQHVVLDFGIPGNVGAVARRTTTVGDGAATSFLVTHGFGTLDVHVELYDNATNETIIADVSRLDVDTITIAGFTAPPPVDSVRVIVLG